jgi:hypothetical protein
VPSPFALQIELRTGKSLFFDPTYDSGIRIGDLSQHAIWAENASEREHSFIDLLPNHDS